MANKRTQAEREKKERELNRKVLINRIERASVIVIGVVVVLAVLYAGGLLGSGMSAHKGTPAVSGLNEGVFYKVSPETSLNPHVYFISWLGCPVGATNSWGLLYAFNKFTHVNLTNHVETHTSDPNEGAWANIPGLIFLFGKFQVYNITFQSVYLYNEYLNATANGSALQGTPIHSGLTQMQSDLPNTIYQDVVKMNLQYNLTKTGKPIATLGHITTTIVIVNQKGTFAEVGPFFSPTDLSGHSPAFVMNHKGQFPGIGQSGNYIYQVLGGN